ncbi:hypothetical protein P691DRAFT_769409, partial [Macrolepiota fuliginosa MF-IS2]
MAMRILQGPATPQSKRRKGWGWDDTPSNSASSTDAQENMDEDVFHDNNSTPTPSPQTAPSLLMCNELTAYRSQSSTEGSELALRAQLTNLVKGAIETSIKILSLTGKHFHKEDQILALTTNLLETMTGQYPSPSQDSEASVSEAIKTLAGEVKRIAEKVDHLPNGQQNPPDTSLAASTHNPNTSFPKSYANATVEQHPTHPDKTGLSQYRPPTNPNKAHHPSRVVISFNEPIPADKRRDEATIVSDINSHLAAQGAPPQLKIIAIKWNSQGNCIAFTRSDQNAAAI